MNYWDIWSGFSFVRSRFVRLGIVQWLFLLSALCLSSQLLASCDEIDVFMRDGCPHCAKAEQFLQQLQRQQPQLQINYFEVNQHPEYLQRLVELSLDHGIDPPGVPTFRLCDQVIVGFAAELGTDQAIVSALGLAENSKENQSDRVINTPFGELNTTEMSLPTLTLVLGLIDGFNPCAMWVLLFLLSVLVNIKQRRRVLLIAGVFVLVSGMVYFAFMAAWLNIFLIVGHVRSLQLVLGALAILIGIIHIKDFFALQRGPSLSIPDRVKPELYARVRNIVQAENLAAALIGVTLVAVLVNFVELLCTAGLPAIYTQVLSQHDLPQAGFYGYLALYNLAYIFDDALMVTLVVVTMKRYKMQQQHGRWLKLVSGMVILILGLLLMLEPELLF